jgi:hypothetical protein
MPLKVGNLWARDEDVLPCPRSGLLLFYLEFDDFGRVLYDLGDKSLVT